MVYFVWDILNLCVGTDWLVIGCGELVAGGLFCLGHIEFVCGYRLACDWLW